MPKTYFDDFTKLPIDKMSQAISDMTYSFNETKVPKKHYKDTLSKGYEEVLKDSISISLVNTIYGILENLKKESPQLFYKALLLLDMNIKPSAITNDKYQAMAFTAECYEQSKSKTMLDKHFLDIFTDTLKNGVTYQMKGNEEE